MTKFIEHKGKKYPIRELGSKDLNAFLAWAKVHYPGTLFFIEEMEGLSHMDASVKIIVEGLVKEYLEQLFKKPTK